jgi:hypothetical protein
LNQNSKYPSADLAYFTRDELHELLPGVVLPDHHDRLEFLARFVWGTECAVDLYNLQGRPLVTHPFEPRYNPLVFGWRTDLRLTNQ